MAKPLYKVEFGPQDDRKVKLGLSQSAVMTAYRSLIAAGESNITIIAPSGQVVDDLHQFSLNTERGGVQ